MRKKQLFFLEIYQFAQKQQKTRRRREFFLGVGAMTRRPGAMTNLGFWRELWQTGAMTILGANATLVISQGDFPRKSVDSKPSLELCCYSTFSIKWEFDKMGVFGQNRLLFFHGKMGGSVIWNWLAEKVQNSPQKHRKRWSLRFFREILCSRENGDSIKWELLAKIHVCLEKMGTHFTKNILYRRFANLVFPQVSRMQIEENKVHFCSWTF